MINYLLDPFIQIENSNGQPVVGAKIYVYYTGSRTLAPIYSNKAGTSLANPAITDTLGNVTIFAKTGSFYDVLVYDNDGTLLFSKINVTPSDSTAADVREVDIVAGFGIQVHKRYQGNKAIYNVAIDPDEAATQADVAAKQDKLTPGANIEITNDNTINVVNRKTLYTQWPIKMDRSTSMLKLYLDQDFVDNSDNEIIPGIDLNLSTDASGRKVIGVDTNGVVSGDYNFVAGYNTYANGNYNFVAGAGCSANGNRNTVFGYDNATYEYSNFAIGANNSASGSCNFVGGQNNVAKGTANTVLGVGNSITDNTYNCNTIIGQYATQGDYYFAVGNGNQNTRSNALEVRKNGDIYYKYNNQMIQLAPSNDTDPLVHGLENTAKNTHNPTTSAFDEIYGHKNYLDGYQNGIFGINNKVDGSNIYIFGQNNNMSAEYNGTPASVCIGNENNMSACWGTFLIGNQLSGDNGSYNRIKIGFGNNYLEINEDGTFYKVVNGVKTAI